MKRIASERRKSSDGPAKSASASLRWMSAMYSRRRLRLSSVMNSGFRSGRSSTPSSVAASSTRTSGQACCTSSRSNGWSSTKRKVSRAMLSDLAICATFCPLAFQLIWG
ncbi:MAG TPA: hypothetical protein VM759_10200 [Longimicrobium sp.]|nr:hypothetical protein [Longimicrobium sp.]